MDFKIGKAVDRIRSLKWYGCDVQEIRIMLADISDEDFFFAWAGAKVMDDPKVQSIVKR